MKREKEIRKILSEWFGILFTSDKVQEKEHSPAERSYTVLNLVIMFFVFSMAGWIWEVVLGAVKDGVIANRGVLYGPWLPIYGRGAVLILVLLKKFRSRPIAEFFAIMILCGSMEYFISWYLEIMHDGQRWWDYTGYFLNLNGRICAAGLLLFGAVGMAVVYAAAPRLDDLLKKIRPAVLLSIAVILVTIYVGDQICSTVNPNTGNGITYCTENS